MKKLFAVSAVVISFFAGWTFLAPASDDFSAYAESAGRAERLYAAEGGLRSYEDILGDLPQASPVPVPSQNGEFDDPEEALPAAPARQPGNVAPAPAQTSAPSPAPAPVSAPAPTPVVEPVPAPSPVAGPAVEPAPVTAPTRIPGAEPARVPVPTSVPGVQAPGEGGSEPSPASPAAPMPSISSDPVAAPSVLVPAQEAQDTNTPLAPTGPSNSSPAPGRADTALDRDDGLGRADAPAQAPAPAVSAQQALEHVDGVRAPGADFVFTVTAVQVNKPDAADNVFSVRVRESKKSLVLYREPIKQRGRSLLMDGPDMWIYIPGTSRSMRISPQQQLVGGVSHADVARVVFSLDYTADRVETVAEDGKQLYKLSLTSKSGNSPYKTVDLYCTGEFAPQRAEFFALSGKLLRTAYFEGYRMVLGKMRPMSIRMVSAISRNENVTLNYSDMEIKETPLAHYQPSYLDQLR